MLEKAAQTSPPHPPFTEGSSNLPGQTELEYSGGALVASLALS